MNSQQPLEHTATAQAPHSQICVCGHDQSEHSHYNGLVGRGEKVPVLCVHEGEICPCDSFRDVVENVNRGVSVIVLRLDEGRTEKRNEQRAVG